MLQITATVLRKPQVGDRYQSAKTGTVIEVIDETETTVRLRKTTGKAAGQECTASIVDFALVLNAGNIIGPIEG